MKLRILLLAIVLGSGAILIWAPTETASNLETASETENSFAYVLDIQPGAYEQFVIGEYGYVIPPVLTLQVGDRVEIINNDSFPHMAFYQFVLPGRTATITYEETGNYVYSSGCAANPSMNSFTTVLVYE